MNQEALILRPRFAGDRLRLFDVTNDPANGFEILPDVSGNWTVEICFGSCNPRRYYEVRVGQGSGQDKGHGRCDVHLARHPAGLGRKSRVLIVSTRSKDPENRKAADTDTAAPDTNEQPGKIRTAFIVSRPWKRKRGQEVPQGNAEGRRTVRARRAPGAEKGFSKLVYSRGQVEIAFVAG